MNKIFILCLLCIPAIAMDRNKVLKNKYAGRLAIRLPFKRTFAECSQSVSTDSAPENCDEWAVKSEDESDLAQNHLLTQKTRLYYQERPEKNIHLQELLNGIRSPEVVQILDNLTIRQTITLLDELEKPEYNRLPLDQVCVTLCHQLGYLGKDKAL